LSIRPIQTDEDFATAMTLLAQGFPAMPRSNWTAYFDRLHKLGDNARAGVPPGYLLATDNGSTGVIVTPASVRRHRDGSKALIVNLSSWYVQQSDRWRAGRMLLAVLQRHDAIYTDLTPTKDVQRVLVSLGFVPLNSGVTITVLPAFAVLPASGMRVRILNEREPSLPASEFEMLTAHRAVGCMAAVLDTGDSAMPLLFRKRMLKGVPAIKLIYCPDVAKFQSALPAVARFLLRRGAALMMADDIGQALSSGQLQRHRSLKFVRPGAGLAFEPNSIDHTSSELALLDL
jgi:hypothetical protein